MEQEGYSKGKVDVEYLHIMEPVNPASSCPYHQSSKLELYCETCGTVICFKCTIKTHNGHKYNLMSEFPPSKRNLAFLLRPVEGKTALVEKALATLVACEEEITEHKLCLQAEIESVANKIHKALDMRKRELNDDIRDKTHLKLKALAAERDTKETVHAQLSSSAIRIKDCLAMSDVDMLRVKKELVRKAKSVNSHFETCPDILEIKTKEDISFARPENFAKECASFGQIFTPTSLDPLKFEVRGRGLETAEVGKESVVVLTAKDHEGNIYHEPPDSLDCKLVFEEAKETEKCMVQSRGNGLYEITHTPTKRGRYQLHITTDRREVKGSPFTVVAKPTLEQLSEFLLVIGNDIIKPWGVALNSEDQELFVTESDQNRVSVFSIKGKKLRSFGQRGSGPNQFDCPRGIALDNEGNVFVVDSGNHRVQKFTLNGHFLASTSGNKGAGRKIQLLDPKNIAYNTTNSKVYVSDVTQIHILNSDLTPSGTFGSKGTGKEQFTSAFGVVCDTFGSVYVSDNSNNNIQIFTPEGQFLKVLQNESRPSPRGFVKGLLGGKVPMSAVGAPTGLAIDDSRRVYVCSEQSHQVAVVTPDGQWVWSVGEEGFTSGKFKRPRGVAVSNSGHVYVCDYENGRIQVF